jgi:hypothetical protein
MNQEAALNVIAEPDDCHPVASLLNHVASGIRAIEGQYASTVMMAVKKLAEDLSLQMARASSTATTADMQQLMASTRKAFEDRILDSYIQRNDERQSLCDEIKSLQIEWNGPALLMEIAQTELAIENSEAHIDWMLRDMSVDLARIMRARIYQSELKAYLRGLRFQAHHHDTESHPASQSNNHSD